jgi:hypothetical protein
MPPMTFLVARAGCRLEPCLLAEEGPLQVHSTNCTFFVLGSMTSVELILIACLLVITAVAIFLGTRLYLERRIRTQFLSGPHSNLQGSITVLSRPDAVEVRSEAKNSTFSRAEAIRFESTTGRSSLDVRIPSKKYMEAQSWKHVELSEQSRAWLAPFIQGASEALKAPLLVQLASAQTFRIVFDGAGELMRSQSGEGFRSILIDKNSHQIVSHGLLQVAPHTAANGLLLWECAAFIVGRKYLADIDRRLNRIDVGIADIRAFLENERIGKLQAACKLLSDTGGALRKDPSFLFRNPAIQQSLESAEQNASAVARACILDLQSIRHGFNKAGPLKALSNADLTPLSEAVSKSVQTLQAISFALSLRICCAAFLSSYMDDDTLRIARLEDIATLWRTANDESKSMQLASKEKINSISEWLSFESTVEAKKLKTISEVNGFFLNAAKALKSSKDELTSVDTEHSVLGAAAAPMELAITVDRGGKVITARIADRSA